MARYNVSFPEALIERIDAERGRVPRSQWLQEAALTSLSGEVAERPVVAPAKPTEARTVKRAAVQKPRAAVCSTAVGKRGVKFDPAKFNRAASLR